MMRGARRHLPGIAAFLIYGALSFIFFGRGLVGHFYTWTVGVFSDTSTMMWFLVWWPRALGADANPFFSTVVWAPGGYNLTWTTSMPLAGLAAAPLTLTMGPIATYNLLCLLCPALAGWAAYILIRYVTRNSWAGLLGGYLFGFSPYVLGHIRAHVVLLFIFPVPLAVYLFLRALRGEIRRTVFIAALGALLTAEFLLETELFATTTMFGAIALAVAICLYPNQTRVRLASLILPILASYALTILLVSPFLYYMLVVGPFTESIYFPVVYSADLVNFIIPTTNNLLGTSHLLVPVSSRFLGNIMESDAYLGLPLIAIVFTYGWQKRKEAAGRFLVILLGLIVLFSLGPRLHIAGSEGATMPWRSIARLPLIRLSLPGRFAMYADLVAAIVVSMWLAESAMSRGAKVGIAALIVISLLPNAEKRHWVSDLKTPEFFSTSMFRKYLAFNETVVILPYGLNGNSMLWQALTGMYFKMAGGWTSITPAEFARWPIVPSMILPAAIPDQATNFKAFLAAHGVSTVIASPNDPDVELWQPMLASLGVTPVNTGGVTIYRIVPRSLDSYAHLTPLELETRTDAARFDALLTAAQTYIAAGRPLAGLTPLRAQQLGLLPDRWVVGPKVQTYNGLWLGPWENGDIGVGVDGSFAALQPLIARYRSYSKATFYPYPHELSKDPDTGDQWRPLVMVFDRGQLARAVHDDSSAIPTALPQPSPPN